MAALQCSKCGTTDTGRGRFCPACGAPMDAGGSARPTSAPPVTDGAPSGGLRGTLGGVPRSTPPATPGAPVTPPAPTPTAVSSIAFGVPPAPPPPPSVAPPPLPAPSGGGTPEIVKFLGALVLLGLIVGAIAVIGNWDGFGDWLKGDDATSIKAGECLSSLPYNSNARPARTSCSKPGLVYHVVWNREASGSSYPGNIASLEAECERYGNLSLSPGRSAWMIV